jgi:hypothetical protein
LDLRRLALVATILHGDRPMLVISPPTPDLQVAQREPFPTEAGPTHQRDGPLVSGLDARLHAVEPQVSEGVLEDELEPFPHEPLPGEGLEGVVAEDGVPERPVDDLAESEVADDRTVVVATDHEARVVRTAVALEFVVSARGRLGIRPGTMKGTRSADPLQELLLIAAPDRADVHPAAALEDVRHPRECRSGTTILALHGRLSD